MSLAVSLMGRVSISAGGLLIDEERFPGRQGRLVFAYLASEQGRALPRDELAEALWGDSPPATWDKALAGIVSKLRALLGECGADGTRVLTGAFGCYRLALPEGSSVDVLAAARGVEAAAAALAANDPDLAKVEARRAVSVTRLPLLPGENGSWVEGKRRELADVLARALDCLAEACLRSGDHSEAARWAEEAIDLEPFRETGYRHLMQAHAVAGNRAEALRVYERCRLFLADELGTYPSPETESIYRELLSASPAEAARDDVVRDEAPPVEKARKIVTVLVCEVVDSQTIWHRLDPEAIERVETRYFDAVSGVVERHGGTVEQSVGDAVTAVFGIPQLHEDDALRALRAALDLPAAVADVGLTIRVGVDTGEAIAGGTRLVAGNVIAAAARLQRLADPGEVLIGDDTHRLVAQAVRSQLLEPVGDEPLKAWRLLGLGGDGLQLAAPFVGRGRELKALRAALTRAAEQRRCRVCTIAGPPGIGKSRLADRFLESISREATVLVGHCLSYGEGITYWPLREIVQELSDGKPRTWIEARLNGDASAAGVAERIASALGAGVGGAQATETFWAFRKLFEALATERPLVLAIDDIHWAEPTLLELFEHLAGFSASAPILLLCLARPELFEKRAEWAVPNQNRTILSLEPLRAVESRALVRRLARAQELPEQARARAVEAAEGNPLFLEQLVAHESDGASELMPPTIHALLAARIDRLDPGERSALERAAIGGRTFESDAVAELLPDDQVGQLSERLLALVQKDFIEPSGERFRFRHILVREAAYQAMPKELRADLHERYADRLETGGGDDELVGYHLEQATRCLTDVGAVGERSRALAARATERLGLGGRTALRRGDIRGGVNLLSRSVSLMEPSAAVRLQFLPDLAEALSTIGEHGRAGELLAEAAERAEAARDTATGWRARLQQAWLRFQTDPSVDVAGVVREANASVSAFEDLRDDRALAHAWHLIAWVAMTYGRLSALADAVERGRRHARSAGDAMTDEDLTVLALLVLPTGPLPTERVIAAAEAELERARSTGSRRIEGAALLVLAICAAFQERFDRARALLSDATAIDEELGGGRGSGFQYTPAGMIELLAGDVAGAERELRSGYESLRAKGDAWFLCGVAAELADILWLQERDDEALELTHLSEELVAEDVLVAQMMWRGARAKVLARRGQGEEAEGLAREGVAIIEATEHVLYHADALTDLAEVLRLRDRADEAVATAERARFLYEQKGSTAAARKLQALIDELRARAVAG